MVRPADAATRGRADGGAARACRPAFPLYGTIALRGRPDLLARAARGPRRARAAGAADRARRQGRRPDRHRPGDVHDPRRHRERAGPAGRRIQPRAARAHRLRRTCRRPACCASAAARDACCCARARRVGSTRSSTRCGTTSRTSSSTRGRIARTEDEVGRDFDRAENYLSLVGLVIVILGGIAVSSVTRVFILQKIRSIAVLKCVGARSAQIIARLHAAGDGARPGGQPAGRRDGAARRSPPFRWRSARRRRRCWPTSHYGVTWSAALQGIGDRRAGVAAVFGRAAAAGAARQAVAAAARRDGAAPAATGCGSRRSSLVSAGARGASPPGRRHRSASALIVVRRLLRAGARAACSPAGCSSRPWRRCANAQSFPLRHAVLHLSRPGNQTRVILLAVGLGAFFIVGVRSLQASLLAGVLDPDRRTTRPTCSCSTSSAGRPTACARFSAIPRTAPARSS